VKLLAELSDTPVTSATYAWFMGRTGTPRCLSGAWPRCCPTPNWSRADRLAAWASRRHSATTIYWLHDGVLELTLDEDLEQAITTILNDVAPAGSSVRPGAGTCTSRPIGRSPSATVRP
jgi:hypothetical protein